MDDSKDRQYSRAPEFEDFLTLCRFLNAEGVRYVVIGGFAVILHGSVRTTQDIDLLVDTSDENMQLVKRAMAGLPDNAVALIEDDDVRKHQVVRVADEFVVDLMGKACGITYDEAIASGVEKIIVEDVDIPVASKELLIKTKDTVRTKDKTDIAYLLVRIEEEKKQN